MSTCCKRQTKKTATCVLSVNLWQTIFLQVWSTGPALSHTDCLTSHLWQVLASCALFWHKSGHQSSPRPEIAIKSGLLKLSNCVSQYLLLLSFQMPMPFDFLLRSKNVKINWNWNYLKIYNHWLIWHGETLDFNSNIMLWIWMWQYGVWHWLYKLLL